MICCSFSLYIRMLSVVSDILTAEQLPPGSRLSVSLSAQLLLQLDVQISGVKGRSITGLTCTETHKHT